MSELDNIEFWNIPYHWVAITLSDLGKGDNAIVDGPFGSNLKTSDYIKDSENGVPVLTTKNLAGDYSESSVRYISKDKYEKLKRSEVKPGDILVAKIGSIGKTGVYPQRKKTAIIPANLLKFTVTDNVCFGYVYNYLNYFAFQRFIKNIATATAQPAFNVTKFRLLPIPLPPLNEQHRIVAKIEELFSELDKGIENLKTARDQLKVYRQALLKHAFEGKLTEQWRKENADKLETADQLLVRIQQEREARYQQQLDEWDEAVKCWETEGKEWRKPAKPKKIKIIELDGSEIKDFSILNENWAYCSLGNLIDDPKYGTSKKCNYDLGGTGVLRIPNIVSGRIDSSDLKFAKFDTSELADYQLEKGNILIIRSNGSISIVGKVALIEEKDTDFIYAGYLIKLRPNSKIINPKLLLFLLQAHFLRKQIEYKAKSTSGVNNINSGELQSLIVPIMRTDEQEVIVNELDEKFLVIAESQKDIEINLKRSQALRQSILKKAFSGQLVSQDPNDEPASELLKRIAAEKAALQMQNKAANQRTKPAKIRSKTC